MTDNADDFTVLAVDAVSAGFCIKGVKLFFEGHGLSFQAFVKHGIPASAMLALNDAQSDRVVSKARERVRG